MEKKIVWNLYRNAIDADHAWHDMLTAKYGKRAGDERYYARNHNTVEHNAWQVANQLWRDAHKAVYGY